MKNKSYIYFIVLLALYCLLSVVYTLPLNTYFGTGIPFAKFVEGDARTEYNRPGDHLQLYYRFWLFKDSLTGNSRFFENRYEFNTDDDKTLKVACYFMPYPLIFAMFSIISGAAGYNAVVLSSYLFAGGAMYLLLMYYTKDRFASMAGGLVFAIAPYRTMSILSGHPTGLSMFLLPLFIYYIEKMMEQKRLLYSVLAGVVFIIITDHDLHVLYFTTLVSPFFVIRHFFRKGRTEFWGEVKTFIMPVSLFVLICMAAIVGMYLRVPVVSGSGTSIKRTLKEVMLYSPWIRDIFFRNNPQQSRFVYLGAASCLFVGAMFIVSAIKFRFSKDDRKYLMGMLFFILMLGISYVFVFGPGSPVGDAYKFLYKHLPKMSMIRQSSKLMIITVFALAVCVGIAFAYLRKKLKGRRGIIVGCVVIALMLVDYFPKRRVGISILPRTIKAYKEVFTEKPDARVVHVPIWPGNDAWTSHNLYYATIYRTIMINGYSPVPPKDYLENVFLPLKSLNAGQIQKKQYEMLRKFDIEYVVFHEESFPPKVCIFPAQYALDNLMQSPYLELQSGESPIWIFKLREDFDVRDEDLEFVSAITGVVHEGERLGGGEIIEDNNASGGEALLLGKEDDAWTKVRRRTTPGGDFTFSVSVKSGEVSSFTISVFRSDDKSLIKSQSFEVNTNNAYKTVSMEFTLDESIVVFYKVDKPKGSELIIDWTYLRYSDQSDPLPGFEFDDIFHTGNVREHPDASEGKAVYLTNTDPGGKAARGPYRLYEPGEYEITLVLLGRMENVDHTLFKASDPDGRVSIEDHNGKLIHEIPISVSDHDEEQSFKNYTGKFYLDKTTFLSINAEYTGFDLYLDKATIERTGD